MRRQDSRVIAIARWRGPVSALHTEEKPLLVRTTRLLHSRHKTMQASRMCLSTKHFVRVSLASIAFLLSTLAVSEGRHLPRAEKEDISNVARAFTVEDFPAEYVILSQVRHSGYA